jgi:hypothetical protein
MNPDTTQNPPTANPKMPGARPHQTPLRIEATITTIPMADTSPPCIRAALGYLLTIHQGLGLAVMPEL